MSVSVENRRSVVQGWTNVALPICLAAMDACWLFTVAWVFVNGILAKVPVLPLPSPLIVGSVAFAAWGVGAFLLDLTKLSAWLVRVLSMGLGVVVSAIVMFIFSPPTGDPSPQWLAQAAPGMILCFLLWLRGLYRAANRPAFREIYSEFQLGLIVVILGVLIAPIVLGINYGALWSQVAALPVWFFIFSLLALALGNREVLRQEIGPTASGSWGLVLGVSVGLIVLVGTLSALFGGPNLLVMVQQLVQGIIFAVTAAIYGVIYGLLWLFYTLFKPQLPTLDPRATPLPNITNDQQALERLRRLRELENGKLDIPPELLTWSTWIAAIIVIAVTLLIISLGVTRYVRRKPPLAIEERERIGSWGLLMQQLRSLFNRLLARFRRKVAIEESAQADDLAALAARPEWGGTLSVRQIYARFLALGRTAGYPREPQQTPVEYLAVVSTAMPSLREEFHAITAAYLEARYGPLPTSSPAVQAATNAWSRAEPEMRNVVRET